MFFCCTHGTLNPVIRTFQPDTWYLNAKFSVYWVFLKAAEKAFAWYLVPIKVWVCCDFLRSLKLGCCSWPPGRTMDKEPNRSSARLTVRRLQRREDSHASLPSLQSLRPGMYLLEMSKDYTIKPVVQQPLEIRQNLVYSNWCNIYRA